MSMSSGNIKNLLKHYNLQHRLIDYKKLTSNIAFAIKNFPEFNWDYWLPRYLKLISDNIESSSKRSSLVNITTKGQILGKKWLYEKMKIYNKDYGIIFMLAGWSAFLPRLILDDDELVFDKIRSFDIDPFCEKVSIYLNYDWRSSGPYFKAVTQDITKMDYYLTEFYFKHLDSNNYEKLIERASTIINTSCEHIHNFSEHWSSIPKGTNLFIQSTDNDELEEHVNCVKSVDEFIKSAPMSKILYAGEKQFFHYKRFMIVGIK